MLFYVFLLTLATTLVAPSPTLPTNPPTTQTFQKNYDLYGFRDYLVNSLSVYTLLVPASATTQF